MMMLQRQSCFRHLSFAKHANRCRRLVATRAEPPHIILPPPGIEIYQTQEDIERLLPLPTRSAPPLYAKSPAEDISAGGKKASNTGLLGNWAMVAGMTLQYGVTGMIGISLIATFIASRKGNGGPFQFAQSKVRFSEKPETNVQFADVAGLEGAKAEVMEVVDFLRNPDKYSIVGAKIPKGVLLVGPSGTGKTLLARAIAGEAAVPFFSCSASEFIELFVGVGASRIRDLFSKAKEKSPCIVFIDEIDAIGKARGSAGPMGGNDEREQTINQLLTEMDGFEGNTGVIIVAATNRADVLDPALLRPGRFDRQVQVERPNVQGRIDIMGVHTKNKPLAPSVNLDKIARITAGFAGADLENLCNEAAIFAARESRTTIEHHDFDMALERIQLGIERKTTVISEKKRWLVAIHEAGHALVALKLDEFDEVKKVTIVPRGPTGGATYFIPSAERVDSGLFSRQYLENQLAVALGGRVAEEITFGSQEVTTGAQGDIEQVYRIARNMVTSYGFSDKLGPIGWQNTPHNSQATQWDIDQEIKRVVTDAYIRARTLLTKHNEELMSLAKALVDKETLDGEEVLDIVGRPQTNRKH